MRQSIRPTLPPTVIAALSLLALPGPALAAAGSVNDFRLPQGGSTATPAPERQGPVAPDVPESQATPTPAPRATASPTPRATSTPPGPRASAAPRAAITLPAPTRSPTATPTPLPTASATIPAAAATAAPTPTPAVQATPAFTPAPLPQPLPAPTLPPAEAASPGWLAWALGAAALLALLAAGWLVARKRIGLVRREETPVVERPRPATGPAAYPESGPETGPAPAAATVPAAPRDPLQVSLVPMRMSLTLVNAVLTWEVHLANQGSAPLHGLSLAADMISAHADLSVADRSSGPATGADSQALGQLAPGEQLRTGGEIRLPFPHIVPIWHGEIALLMPLLRLRIAADGIMPVTRIFLVGQPSPTDAATLQPFRLDLGPRVYPDLAQRAFA